MRKQEIIINESNIYGYEKLIHARSEMYDIVAYKKFKRFTLVALIFIASSALIDKLLWVTVVMSYIGIMPFYYNHLINKHQVKVLLDKYPSLNIKADTPKIKEKINEYREEMSLKMWDPDPEFLEEYKEKFLKRRVKNRKYKSALLTYNNTSSNQIDLEENKEEIYIEENKNISEIKEQESKRLINRP